MNKAIFLDRDGTINVDKHYLYKIEDFEFLPGAIEALKLFQGKKFKLIIITNQSGIARGYYTIDDFYKLHDYINNELKKYSIKIDGVYFCPHLHEKCNCRKPKTGLFYQAAKDFNIDFSESFAIGDKKRDLCICDEQPVKGYLVGQNSLLDIAHIITKE